jgi:hypothetical protein
VVHFFFQVVNEEQLMEIKNALDQSQIQYYLWIENPECIPTCIALIPYQKYEVSQYVGKYELFK